MTTGIRPEYDIVCGEYGCRSWNRKKGFIQPHQTRQSNELKRIRMYGAGIISPKDGAKPRKVL